MRQDRGWSARHEPTANGATVPTLREWERLPLHAALVVAVVLPGL